ncbi:MAG: DUF2849 domain-containing protein [Paracoccus sp. (in: a-proteobacteria)]|uniref:DUF2849 domain-containing protein n=1 Tax=Paracoccus sp. TaxID=267 RepID=UPI0026DED611|nr:DUF2849 domain-containing protein [Paracoccus sp. (in: a-proteobacteria)]MDO5620502.1 DUF2849 domain-containing protein [Paracoccus sp. (in: a-proteobacteria)]
MARATTQIVTANDLRNGEVVYLTADNRWSALMRDAELLDAEAAPVRLSWAEAQEDAVVGPYLTSVAVADGHAAPDHFRETFRATGPSNRFHGKQERA